MADLIQKFINLNFEHLNNNFERDSPLSGFYFLRHIYL